MCSIPVLKDDILHIYQFSSVAQSYPTLCYSMDCSTPGFPVHHQLPEPAQIHVHQVGDAIQPSHPLSSPSPPALNLSQHQGLFKWVSSSHQVAKVLEFQLQQSVLSMNIQDWFPLGWTGWISLQSKGLSGVFSNTTVKSINSSVLSFLYSPTLKFIHDYWKTIALTRLIFAGKVTTLFFDMPSRLVIAFLPRVKSLLIS